MKAIPDSRHGPAEIEEGPGLFASRAFWLLGLGCVAAWTGVWAVVAGL